MPRLKALLLSLATLSATAFGQNANPARPGTLNYIEGQASIEGRSLSPDSVGTATLESGQYLATAKGNAEILLTPGVFLRLGEDTTVQMVSPSLTHTEVRIEQGQASVEVDQLYKENDLLVDLKNGQTQLLKNGLYTFDATSNTVRVFNGKAGVYPGQDLNTNVKPIEVKEGKELALNGEPAKSHGFDRDKSHDDLYKWGSLRSQYLGEANLSLAERYEGSEGFDPGWYYAGGPYGYTWLPGNGLFWNSFGYGFYSPYYLYGGGLIYGGYGYGGRYGYGYRGGYGGGYYRGGSPIYRGGAQVSRGPGFGGAAPRSGFSGGGGISRGGASFGGGGGGGMSHGGGGGHR